MMARITDKARTQTDKILQSTEKAMGKIYNTDPALIRVQKKLVKYLDSVKKDTQALYDARKEHPQDHEARKAYEDAVREKTMGSKEYNAIIKEFTQALANANKQALGIVNGSMAEVYAVSYNNVADECRRVGIKVNGKE